MEVFGCGPDSTWKWGWGPDNRWKYGAGVQLIHAGVGMGLRQARRSVGLDSSRIHGGIGLKSFYQVNILHNSLNC